jgi:hypothetical protein
LGYLDAIQHGLEALAGLENADPHLRG